MAKTKEKDVDFSQVKVLFQWLDGSKKEVAIQDIILSAYARMADCAFGMDEAQFKGFAHSSGWEKCYQTGTFKEIARAIIKVLGANGCFILVNQNKEFPDAIELILASSLKRVTIRIEKET